MIPACRTGPPARAFPPEEGGVRVVLALAVPVAAAVIQGAVPGAITVGGALPNVPILVAASWSVAAGAREGLWWAFVGGLASDGPSAGAPGAPTCAYTTTA